MLQKASRDLFCIFDQEISFGRDPIIQFGCSCSFLFFGRENLADLTCNKNCPRHLYTSCPKRHGLVVRVAIVKQEDLGSIPAQTKWFFFSPRVLEVEKINGFRHNKLC